MTLPITAPGAGQARNEQGMNQIMTKKTALLGLAVALPRGYLWTMNNNQQDDRLYAAAVRRNREPIFDVLKPFLPETGLVLEVASGTGEHGAYFSSRLPTLTWQPSDPNKGMYKSIMAWSQFEAQAEASTMNPPLELNAQSAPWPIDQAAAIVCINMIHISPWASCLGLMAGAGRILPDGGLLFLYGPYKIKNSHTAESNAAFDQSLQSQNPEWGVRNLEDVVKAAAAEGLQFRKTVNMPANNLSVIFIKDGGRVPKFKDRV